MFKEILKQRFIKNFYKDRILILVVTGIIMFWSLIYLVTFYHPNFKSNAKVWIRDITWGSFVVDNGGANPERNNPLSSLTTSGNPLLTQIQLIESRFVCEKLYNFINEKYPEETKNVKNKTKFIKSHLKAKNEVGADVINIEFSWDKPEIAQELLDVLLKTYENYNLDIFRKAKTAKREYIDKRLSEVEKKLLACREKIKEFQEGSLAINLDEESKLLVEQKLGFSKNLEQLNADINGTRNSIHSLQKELSLTTKEAINAAALGYENKNLVDLRSELAKSKQDYAFNSVRLAKSNPKMLSLDKKINTIDNQINDQIELSIGKNIKSKVNILDPVRNQLVTELATSEAKLKRLIAEKNSIKNSVNKLSSKQADIPLKKYTLDNLTQEERNLSNAYDELKTKQIEANIKEAETISNIVVVDKPDLPLKKSFPNAKHILVLSLVLGIFVGLGVSYIKTYIEDVCEGLDEIEEVTKRPVLGILPWIQNSMNSEEEEKILTLSYENIVSNILIKSHKNAAKVLAFSSNNIKSYNSITIYMVAQELKKLGYSVALIDADFRSPVIHKNANITDKLVTKLSDVIISIADCFKQGISPEHISFADKFTYDENGIAILANKEPVSNAYEYFGTTAFSFLIDKLKKDFDWVLVETPSIVIAPETLIISGKVDALILITTLNVTYSILKTIMMKLKKAEIPFLGCVIRDNDTELATQYLEFYQD